MIIVADIGNSFLKMARWDGKRLTAYLRLRHRGVPDAGWQAGLSQSAGTRSDGVYVASVAGESIERGFEAWLVARGHDKPVFLKAGREACGVRNAYREPGALGVDRWCALIAARAQHEGPVCVVDAGTAMTVDWVDGEGQHRGGLIMPGPALQSESLLEGTRHVRQGASMPGSFFADNTADAVSSGACYSCAALVEHAVQIITREAGQAPRTFITGGEAERIMPLLKTPAVFQQDIVLRGVACLAEARE